MLTSSYHDIVLTKSNQKKKRKMFLLSFIIGITGTQDLTYGGLWTVSLTNPI